MNTIDTMTLVHAAWIAFALVRTLQGRAMGGFAAGMTIAAPFAYMATHVPPGMDTVLGQWALAILNIGGPLAVGGVAGWRRLTRATRRVPA